MRKGLALITLLLIIPACVAPTITFPKKGQAPVINSFTANPGSIKLGDTSTLSWSVSGATEVSIEEVGNVGLSGNQVVAPSNTTTYHLKATNAAGGREASTEVIVASAPAPAKAPAEDYIGRGDAHNLKGDYDEAIADYSKAIELDPHDIIYMTRGFAYVRKGDIDKAIADFSKAIELNPKNVLAYVSRGIGYEVRGDSAKAVSDYEKVIQLATDPKLIESARQALKRLGR